MCHAGALLGDPSLRVDFAKAENKIKALDSGKVDQMTRGMVALKNLEVDGSPRMTSILVSGMAS